MQYLSKSKLMSGWQCPKRLWLEVFEPERAEVGPGLQAAFDTGHRVGAAAQSLWPDGVLIKHDTALAMALQETQERLEAPGPLALFEATLRADGTLIRADILERDTAGDTRLVEVKAATSVKLHYLTDCAIQYRVFDRLGLAPARVELAHINNQFIYAGDGDYRGLFTFEDVTDEVRKLQPQVEDLVRSMQGVTEAAMPGIVPGPQCNDPYECPFTGFCAPQTADYPIDSLPGSSKVKAALKDEGFTDIREIPAGRLDNELQERARRVTAAGEAELIPGADKQLRELGWPRYYLDFETVSFAVPVWTGTGPYKSYPFQWSLHIEHENGELEHREFLADADGPPMRACTEALIAALGTSGPIFMYTAYERRVLNEMAAQFPDLRAPLEAIVERLFDLHPITKAHYYHPDMHGSWSIKAVLPTIAPELAYEDLETISDGTAASNAFAAMITGELPAEDHDGVRRALLEYCKRDTEAMVRLAGRLAAR